MGEERGAWGEERGARRKERGLRSGEQRAHESPNSLDACVAEHLVSAWVAHGALLVPSWGLLWGFSCSLEAVPDLLEQSGRHLGPPGGVWGSSGALGKRLGAILGGPGPPWGRLGAILAASWTVLGATWAVLEPCWAV